MEDNQLEQQRDGWISFRQIKTRGVNPMTLSHWKRRGLVQCRIGADGYNEYLASDIATLVDAKARRQRSTPSAKITYAIADRGLTAVKIGRTGDLQRRFTTFQASSPVDLVVIAIAQADIEGWLHKKLQGHRRHGEWFVFNEAVESGIRSAMRITPEFRSLRGAR